MKAKTYVKGVAALCALAAVACTGVQQSRGDVAVYLDESQPLEKRVEDALSQDDARREGRLAACAV